MNNKRVLIPPGRSLFATNWLSGDENATSYYDDVFYKEIEQSHTALDRRERRFYAWVLDFCRVEIGTQTKCLDVGTGSGGFPAFVCERGGTGYGVDISARALDIARERYPRASYLLQAAETLPFESREMDLITFFGSLEHFEDMAASLLEAARVVRETGKVFILVPNIMSYTNILKVLLRSGQIGTGQILERMGTEREWKALFRSQGFTVDAATGYSFPGSHARIFTRLARMTCRRVLPRCYQEVFCFALSRSGKGA